VRVVVPGGADEDRRHPGYAARTGKSNVLQDPLAPDLFIDRSPKPFGSLDKLSEREDGVLVPRPALEKLVVRRPELALVARRLDGEGREE
jgi:hypothetical protein